MRNKLASVKLHDGYMNMQREVKEFLERARVGIAHKTQVIVVSELF